MHGEAGDRDAFRLTYPFSPAFLHAMVDISGALQRERTALKLMQQLLVDYRNTLTVGLLMPLGAIFDVLAAGVDRPFTDKLRDEFEQAKRFYTIRVRPFLLRKHGPTEHQAAQLGPQLAFRADDLVVKTLLLAALVPNVPALRGLTASRLAALNHGSIVTMLPNQERALVTTTLKQLGAQFGEIRLSGSEDDPRGRRDTTAAHRQPRSWCRRSCCSRPPRCSRPAGRTTMRSATRPPGGTRRCR